MHKINVTDNCVIILRLLSFVQKYIKQKTGKIQLIPLLMVISGVARDKTILHTK